MNIDHLLSEITDLMQLAEAEAAKGGRLHKAGATAHAKTKGEHHGKMAEYHAKIADLHANMQDHYEGGAAGAHAKEEARKAEGEPDSEEPDGEQEPEKDEARKLSGYGALEAVRNRPSRQTKAVTRGEIAEMMHEGFSNFAKSLVAILAPPAPREANADELAAARLLSSRGYVVRTPGQAVEKVAGPVSTVGEAAPDRNKLEKAEPAASTVTDTEIAILKEHIRLAEEKGHMADAALLHAAAEARIKLDKMARDEIRKALRTPHVASSGEIAGYRGIPQADL